MTDKIYEIQVSRGGKVTHVEHSVERETDKMYFIEGTSDSSPQSMRKDTLNRLRPLNSALGQLSLAVSIRYVNSEDKEENLKQINYFLREVVKLHSRYAKTAVEAMRTVNGMLGNES